MDVNREVWRALLLAYVALIVLLIGMTICIARSCQSPQQCDCAEAP